MQWLAAGLENHSTLATSWKALTTIPSLTQNYSLQKHVFAKQNMEYNPA
jgi:hypothetical protein